MKLNINSVSNHIRVIVYRIALHSCSPTMLLLSSKCFIQCILILNILLNTNGVESAFSSKARRTKSMVTKLHPISELNHITRTASPSSASSSSASLSSITSLNNEQKPIASTSSTMKKQEHNSEHFREIELIPIVEESARTALHASLLEATAATHRGAAYLNPARDGVRTRIRNAIRRYGLLTASGSALGIGGFLIGRHFNNNDNNNLTHSSIQPTTQPTTHRSTDSVKNGETFDMIENQI